MPGFSAPGWRARGVVVPESPGAACQQFQVGPRAVHRVAVGGEAVDGGMPGAVVAEVQRQTLRVDVRRGLVGCRSLAGESVIADRAGCHAVPGALAAVGPAVAPVEERGTGDPEPHGCAAGGDRSRGGGGLDREQPGHSVPPARRRRHVDCHIRLIVDSQHLDGGDVDRHRRRLRRLGNALQHDEVAGVERPQRLVQIEPVDPIAGRTLRKALGGRLRGLGNQPRVEQVDCPVDLSCAAAGGCRTSGAE